MKKEKSKKCSLANGQESEPQTSREEKIKSIITLYWAVFALGGIAGILLTVIGDTPPKTDIIWTYLPRCIWILALAVIFFDSFNICFLHGSALYENLAREVRKQKLMSRFTTMCYISGFLFLLNILLMLHHGNYCQTSIVAGLGTIALGWFLTGLLQLTRFR